MRGSVMAKKILTPFSAAGHTAIHDATYTYLPQAEALVKRCDVDCNELQPDSSSQGSRRFLQDLSGRSALPSVSDGVATDSQGW